MQKNYNNRRSGKACLKPKKGGAFSEDPEQDYKLQKQKLQAVNEHPFEGEEDSDWGQSDEEQFVGGGRHAPFCEKHIIESLSVSSYDQVKQLVFYSMLNQGYKRGKETEILALDCERILTKKGDRLARVSIVNYYGNVVFDTLVKPWSKVEDYREWITGIKPMDLKEAPSYKKIAPILRKILNGKIVVGHSLHDDFLALKLDDEEYKCEIREISEFKIFQRPVYAKTYGCFDEYDSTIVGFEKRKLKELARDYLNARIQESTHSSIIDARIALGLYRTYQRRIDQECSQMLHSSKSREIHIYKKTQSEVIPSVKRDHHNSTPSLLVYSPTQVPFLTQIFQSFSISSATAKNPLSSMSAFNLTMPCDNEVVYYLLFYPSMKRQMSVGKCEVGQDDKGPEYYPQATKSHLRACPE